MSLNLSLSFFIVNLFFPLQENNKPKTYTITHENIFDWDNKSKTFKKYNGWWPPENTQIKGVEESVLEVYPNKIQIKKYYHHAYCSELTQTFIIKSSKNSSKLLKLIAIYTENGVYGNCDGNHEIYKGSATIKSTDISFEDLINDNVKDGSIVNIWYYIPSKKEGVKMAIKIKKMANTKAKIKHGMGGSRSGKNRSEHTDILKTQTKKRRRQYDKNVISEQKLSESK